MIQKDKILHFIVGYCVAYFSMVLLLTLNTPLRLVCLWGFMASLFIGVAKEVIDSFNPNNFFDKKDLIATLLGGIVAIICINI